MRLWIGDEERAYVKSDKLLQFRSQKIHVFNHVFIHVFNHVFISTQALIIFIVIWLFFFRKKIRKYERNGNRCSIYMSRPLIPDVVVVVSRSVYFTSVCRFEMVTHFSGCHLLSRKCLSASLKSFGL